MKIYQELTLNGDFLAGVHHTEGGNKNCFITISSRSTFDNLFPEVKLIPAIMEVKIMGMDSDIQGYTTPIDTLMDSIKEAMKTNPLRWDHSYRTPLTDKNNNVVKALHQPSDEDITFYEDITKRLNLKYNYSLYDKINGKLTLQRGYFSNPAHGERALYLTILGRRTSEFFWESDLPWLIETLAKFGIEVETSYYGGYTCSPTPY